MGLIEDCSILTLFCRTCVRFACCTATDTFFFRSVIDLCNNYLENKLQRKRNHKNDPRTCDIDIIDYKGQTINFKYNNLNFTIPHKNLSSRNFVLCPLKEILPAWKHPTSKEDIDVLIKKLSKEQKNSILKIEKS